MLPAPAARPPASLKGLRLAEDVTLSLSVVYKGELSRVELSQSLVHDPELLLAVQRLQQLLRHSLRAFALDCATRRVPLPRERARERLHELAKTFVASAADGRLTWTTSTRGYPRLEAIAQDAQAPRELQLSIARGGKRQGLTFRDDQLAPLLTTLAALMQGSADDAFSALPFVTRSVLRILHSLEALQGAEAVGPSSPVAADLALRITHLAHAGALVEAAEMRIAIDPWLSAHADHYEVQPMSARELGRLDAVLLTHHHEDHMVQQALLTLPRDVPLFVPAFEAAPVAPDYATALTLMGFTDVRVVTCGDRIELPGEVVIDVLPFVGEGRDRLGYGAHLYAVSRAGRSVLFHADASPDSHGGSPLSDPAFAAFLARQGEVSVVFGTWWQERRFAVDMSVLAPLSDRLDVDSWLDDTECCDVPFSYHEELVQRTGASLFVSYAEQGDGLFEPFDPINSYLEAAPLTWRPFSELEQVLRSQTGARLIRALPRMVVSVPKHGPPNVDWSAAPKSHVAAAAAVSNSTVAP